MNRWKDEISLLKKLDDLALREVKHDELIIAYEQTQIAAVAIQAELNTSNLAVTEGQKESAASVS